MGSGRRPARAETLRIGMIGQKGVPATYGGIERHVEEIGARLAARGHEVTVYCRTNYGDDRPSEHRGMQLVHLRTLATKHLDAIAHAGLSSLAALGHHDIVHYHAIGPGLAAPLTRLASRARVVLTVHGLDDQRSKWGRGAQSVLRGAQWMSARVPHATVAVSETLVDHYLRQHARHTVYIPNGVAPATAPPADLVRQEFGLEPDGYVLFVGRLVQEKAPDLLMRAFRRLSTDRRLVVAGGSSYTDGYVADLTRLAATDSRVLLPGYVYGDALAALYAHAAAFVLPSAVEGLPLTLLEAAAHGVPVLASDIPPHIEVLGRDGPGRRLFASGDEVALAATLDRVLSGQTVERAGALELRDEILGRYSWELTTNATEMLYLALTGRLHRVVNMRAVRRDLLVAA